MVQPYLIQSGDYTNAMIQGLQANLAYLAESKKGGGMRVSRGGGKEEKSSVVKAKEDFDKRQDERTKENKERNEMYRAREDAKDKENLLAEPKEASTKDILDIENKKADLQKKGVDLVMSFKGKVPQNQYDDFRAWAVNENKYVPDTFLPSAEEMAKLPQNEYQKRIDSLLGMKQEDDKFDLFKKQEDYKRTQTTKDKKLDKAQQLVLSLAKQHAPSLSDALLVSLLGDKVDQNVLKDVGGKIPEDLKPAYYNAVKTLNEYYKDESQAAGVTNAAPDQTKLQIKPPAGFVDTGKTSGGKRVFMNGNQAWVEP